jgi:DNA-binding transcriptional LysR family regulator
MPLQLIDRYLRKAGIRPKELFELDGLEAVAVMVDRGLGVSILPDWAPALARGPFAQKDSFARPLFYATYRTDLEASFASPSTASRIPRIGGAGACARAGDRSQAQKIS